MATTNQKCDRYFTRPEQEVLIQAKDEYKEEFSFVSTDVSGGQGVDVGCKLSSRVSTASRNLT